MMYDRSSVTLAMRSELHGASVAQKCHDTTRSHQSPLSTDQSRRPLVAASKSINAAYFAPVTAERAAAGGVLAVLPGGAGGRAGSAAAAAISARASPSSGPRQAGTAHWRFERDLRPLLRHFEDPELCRRHVFLCTNDCHVPAAHAHAYAYAYACVYA